MNLEQTVLDAAKNMNNTYTRGYNVAIDHAIDIILVVAKMQEKFPAELALLLVDELDKRKIK